MSGAAGLIRRVVIVLDDLARNGGAESVARASAMLLREQDIDVTVLGGSGDFHPDLARAGIETVSLGGHHLLEGARGTAALRGLYDPRTARAAAGWIARHDEPGTVYHLHNWHKFLSPSIFAALRPVEDRLFLTAHDFFLACPNGGFYLYPQARSCELRPMSAACVTTSCDRRHYAHKLWRVARQAVRQTTWRPRRSPATLLAVHEGMVPLLARSDIPASIVRVLRNPVTPWRDTRIAAESNQRVFFVGRVEEDKGIDVLARAARMAGVALTVCGEGLLREDLTRQYPEVEFLGYKSRAEIAALVATARFLVVPTRWRETFGLVTLEAILSGLPVVISTTALIAPEVVDGGFGIPCDPSDAEGLSTILRRLRSDDAAIADMSRTGFAEGRRLAPTPAEWIDELIRLYADKLTSHATSRPQPVATRTRA